MKLSPVKINLIQQATTVQSQSNVIKPQFQNNVADLKLVPCYINFKGIEESDYLKAKKYLEYKKSKLSKTKQENISIKDFDLDKLNGIQQGINIFDGLSFKQVAFVISKLLEVATFRGCYNNCAHCYAEAKHPIKETNDFISKMDWDDFTNLMNGIEELHNRLGFVLCDYKYNTSFHDADCSQIEIKDKNGNTYDWYDLATRQYKATQKEQLFDTAGWYIQDKKAQKRVENCIEKILKDDKTPIEVNISANPYHSLHFRAVEHMRTGNKEKEEYFRKKDSERMANVLFTMTPLLNANKENIKVCFIARAMKNDSKNSKGFAQRDLKKTFQRHFEELEKLYIKDFETEQKIIKDKKDIKRNIYKYQSLLKTITTTPAVTNKLVDLYADDDIAKIKSLSLRVNDPEKIFKSKDKYNYVTIIDANGKVYLSNIDETYNTDIQLNLKNKNKKTVKIMPNICNKAFTSNLIEEFLKNTI